MISRFTTLGGAALAAFVLVAAPHAATAQQTQGQQGQQGQTQPAPDPATIPEAELDAFAEVWVEVRGVAEAYQPQINEAAQGGDDAKAKQLSEQANGEMREAIEEHPDMSLDRYRQIVAAAQADEQFADRLRGKLEQKAGATQTQ